MVTGIALLINWASNKQIPGLLGIAAGYMATCVGVLLASMQGILPPVVSIFLANALIMGGRIPVLFGLANFWNQENTKLPLFCIVWFVGSIAGFYYFTFVDENILWRIRIYTVMMVIFSASIVYVAAKGLKIERKLRPVMAINTAFGAFLLLTLTVFNAVTEFTLMFSRRSEVINSTEEATVLFLLSSIVTMTVFAISILIMTMEELKVEYQKDATFDPITTILNERTFVEVSNRVLGVALRYTKPVSMLTLELTNLDNIVKQHGAKVGNAMLRHFALMASDRRRNEDVLARSNYKQFRMLLPGIDEAGSKVVIKKIGESLLGEEYIYRGNSLKAEFLICAITKREEDLHLQQMLQEGEVDIIRMKQKQQTPA